jgi:hypothetical protein
MTSSNYDVSADGRRFPMIRDDDQDYFLTAALNVAGIDASFAFATAAIKSSTLHRVGS